MGLLQGPRLMARTTKSPIRRNHWVPLGCRGHLGSVKAGLFVKFCISLVKQTEAKLFTSELTITQIDWPFISTKRAALLLEKHEKLNSNYYGCLL